MMLHQVQYVIDRMDQRETLKPLADEGEDPDDDDEGVEAGKAKTTRVLVVGAGAAGLAAASVLAVRLPPPGAHRRRVS